MPRQVIVHAPFDVRLDDVPAVEHQLGEFEILARTEVSALSPGTETRIYTGLESKRFSYRVQYPFSLGYNNVGKILAVGHKVREYREGQRIFTRMPHRSEYVVAERIVGKSDGNPDSNVPQSHDVIAPVPNGVSSEHAVFTHLFVLGFNALHRGQYRFGENVVIIGLGVVGLGAVCMARAAGARVAAIGNSSSRLEIASRMGADEVWITGEDNRRRAALFGGEAGIDLVIVCTDAWPAMKTASEIARRNTRIAVLGFPGIGQGPMPFDPFEPADFYNKSLAYISVSWMAAENYPPEYQRFTVTRMYRYILDLMSRKRIDLTPVVTHHFPVERIQDAFDLVLSKDKSAIGIVLDWEET